MVSIKSVFLTSIFLTLVIALLMFIFAENITNNNNNHSIEMQKIIDNLKCRNDLMTGHISTIISLDPLANLSADTDKLTSDLTQLQTFVTNNDFTGFKNFIKNNYDSDLKSSRESVLSWRKDKRSLNLTLIQKKNIRDNYAQLKSSYDTCFLNSLKNTGQGRVTAFTVILDAHQKRAELLKAKGVDTSSLDKVISDARTQIVDLLKTALDSATDAKSVQNAIQSYCLYDGCKQGINFHLEAKFEIAKLNIALNIIKTNRTNVSSDNITQLQNLINSAQTALNTVGTSRYTDQTKKQVWDNIKSAYALIKDIHTNLQGEKQNE